MRGAITPLPLYVLMACAGVALSLLSHIFYKIIYISKTAILPVVCKEQSAFFRNSVLLI